MNTLKLGIIGAGRIGKLHARNLKHQVPGAELSAVADIYEEPIRELAEELEIPKVSTDYREILEEPEIDGVVICTSTDTHARIISEAADKGKHVFCEKPIALKMDKIDRALEAVDKAGVKLAVGFNRRYDPSFKKARELVAAGEIGQPYLVKITSRDPEPPSLDYIKISGGIFLDMTIHDFDMARYLLDQEVTEIMATGACLVNQEIAQYDDVDTAITNLKYESGALGVIDNCRETAYGYDNRIEVFGSEGSVAVGHKKPTEVMVQNEKGITGDKPLYFFTERYQEAYVAEMEDFVKVVVENRRPLANGQDGKIAVQMGYAAGESLAKGKFVKVENNV
ncbi:MAG: inositol 2-dehydrogenase [Bacillota bacterium]